MNGGNLVILFLHIQFGLCDVTKHKMSALHCFVCSIIYYTNICNFFYFDRVCGRLFALIRACISESLASVVVSFNP